MIQVYHNAKHAQVFAYFFHKLFLTKNSSSPFLEKYYEIFANIFQEPILLLHTTKNTPRFRKVFFVLS
jgi:hypothetical protein